MRTSRLALYVGKALLYAEQVLAVHTFVIPWGAPVQAPKLWGMIWPNPLSNRILSRGPTVMATWCERECLSQILNMVPATSGP